MTTPEDVIAAAVNDWPDQRDGGYYNEADAAQFVVDALAAAGYEVVPAGIADRLAALLDAIVAHRDAESDGTVGWMAENDERLWAAVQPPDPKDPTDG